MKYSLVSREVIADSIETVVGCEGLDGFVAIGAATRICRGADRYGALNRPRSLFMAAPFCPVASPAIPASWTSCLSLKRWARTPTAKLATRNWSRSSPAHSRSGSCGGMYTANTMASAIEALGMSLPNSSAKTPFPKPRRKIASAPGAVLAMLQQASALDIMTRPAFENAITVAIALAVRPTPFSTCWRLPCRGVKLALDDFTKIGRRVPVLGDLKPSGKYLMSELVAIGGISQ